MSTILSTNSNATKVLGIVIVGLGATALTTFLYRYYKYWKNETEPKKWKRVGILQQIYLYPIKSCAPIDLNADISVNCEVLGMRKGDIIDRSFMLIDDQDAMVTGRIYPKLVQITVKIMNRTNMIVSAPGMDDDLEIDLIRIGQEATRDIRTKVWNVAITAMLCGERYDAWFSKYVLGKHTGLRLVFYPYPAPVRQVEKRLQNGVTQMQDTGAFPDATSYHLINLSSVDDLSNRLNKPVNPLQFRPNFLLQMDNPTPFVEDKWKWMKIGNEATFRIVAPCGRCIFININPFSAERDPEGNPLKMLRTYRKKKGAKAPDMGIHLGIRSTGFIKANDIIYVEDESN